jgi:hypothetical protein
MVVKYFDVFEEFLQRQMLIAYIDAFFTEVVSSKYFLDLA